MEDLRVPVISIDQEIEELNNEYDLEMAKVNEIRKRIQAVENKRAKEIWKNKTYFTFPLARQYRGKEIESITFLTSKGTTETMTLDEYFYVEDDGYPFYSSYDYGILEAKNGVIYRNLWGIQKKKDFIGFIELKWVKGQKENDN